jgi:hypothetical protein
MAQLEKTVDISYRQCLPGQRSIQDNEGKQQLSFKAL